MLKYDILIIKIGVVISMNNNKTFDELTKKFDNLVKEERLDINTIEDLMLNDIENYKKMQKKHIEHLLKNNINEKELIIKKNRNGKKKDLI